MIIRLRYFVLQGIVNIVGVTGFDSDFEWLSIIECLKKAGMPIKEIKKFKEEIPEKLRNERDKAKGVQYIEEQQ